MSLLEIASVTGSGYTRIIGELRKLRIKGISRQTVRNIFKEEGIQPGPDRTSDTWNDFIERHGETLWACDFFSVKTTGGTHQNDQHASVSRRFNAGDTSPKSAYRVRHVWSQRRKRLHFQ